MLKGRHALRASWAMAAGRSAPVDVSLLSGNVSQDANGAVGEESHGDVFLEFLGTSSAVPTLSRNVSCTLLRAGGSVFMVDCGEGTLRQMIKSTASPHALKGVFVTHLHSDHVLGLPGISTALTPPDVVGPDGLVVARREARELALAATDGPVPVFAPHGLLATENPVFTRHALRNIIAVSVGGERPVRHRHVSAHSGGMQNAAMRGLASGPAPPRPRYGFRRTADGPQSHASAPWDAQSACYNVYEDESWRVRAAPIRHSVFCVGYVFEERIHRGPFRVDHLSALGLPPGPAYRDLAEGRAVTTASGRTVTPDDAFDPPRRPRKIAILGDTCDSSAMAPIAAGCDVLVHEATYADEERDVALRHGHSTAGMAGAFARAIGAKALVLTHFSPRYGGDRGGDPSLNDALGVRALVEQARRAFGSPSVYAARDHMCLPIKRHGP